MFNKHESAVVLEKKQCAILQFLECLEFRLFWSCLCSLAYLMFLFATNFSFR